MITCPECGSENITSQNIKDTSFTEYKCGYCGMLFEE